MGETIAKIKVASLTNEKKVELEALVDTGATYTSLPTEILDSLGVKKVDKVNIEFANGIVEERYLGNVFIEVEGKVCPNRVIFAKKGDATVLGLITLESCGLTVDPINRKLVPLTKVHHY
jgi:predicted aspartyl protease